MAKQIGANRGVVRWMILPCVALVLAACTGPSPRVAGPESDPVTEVAEAGPAAPPSAETPPPAAKKPGLFGALFGRKSEPEAIPAAADGAGPEVTTAALETEAPQRSGLFGASPNTSRGVLPFGQIEKTCGLGARQLGKMVAKSQGRGTYKLYDTDPTSIEPRTQYVTGFKDGCARQFTASLALFGTAQVHEATRYNPLNSNPFSKVDLAYEKVKMRVCRVKKGEFCPDRPAKRMDRDAVFLTVYRQFGGSGPWMEVFLHQGRLAAHTVQGG